MHFYVNESPLEVFASLLVIAFGIAAFIFTVFAAVSITSIVFGRNDGADQR